tara:strand:- start:4175 stop:4336 length:162 start_codon:yes stop_codon:yes gene_type:complete
LPILVKRKKRRKSCVKPEPKYIVEQHLPSRKIISRPFTGHARFFDKFSTALTA